MLLVDENVRRFGEEPFEVLAPARALGVYEGGLVPVEAGDVLLRVRAKRIVVATGAVEQPLVFPGNDLVGVMLPDGALRLIDDFGLKPGERAVVIAADERGIDAADGAARAGRARRRDVDLRERRAGVDRGRGSARRAHCGHDRRSPRTSATCSSPPARRQPAYSLLAQAGARVEYDAGARHLRPDRAARRASRRSAA